MNETVEVVIEVAWPRPAPTAPQRPVEPDEFTRAVERVNEVLGSSVDELRSQVRAFEGGLSR